MNTDLRGSATVLLNVEWERCIFFSDFKGGMSIGTIVSGGVRVQTSFKRLLWNALMSPRGFSRHKCLVN